MELQVVTSVFHENTEWMDQPPWRWLHLIVYNKGPKHIKETPRRKVVQMENLGRAEASYLHHIVNNYDSLAAVTLFIIGSWHDDEYRRRKVYKTLWNAIHTFDTTFVGFPVGKGEFDTFQLDEWGSHNPENYQANPERVLQPCSVRPFGRWRREALPHRPIHHWAQCSIFAVAREHIVQHPKSFYQNLLSYMREQSNPEAGHYLERSWCAVFQPYPETCDVHFDTGLPIEGSHAEANHAVTGCKRLLQIKPEPIPPGAIIGKWTASEK
jgi:hypothetical protein